MKLDVRHNFGDVAKRLDLRRKQLRYAVAVALTRTGQDVRVALYDEMGRVFDRPTRYTLRSLFLKRATKETLTARVWLIDDYGSWSNTHSAWYLKPQIFGGSRLQKRFEKLLAERGHMPAGHVAVPANGAKLDRYGNVNRGQIVQIMSQLRVQAFGGYESRRTGSTRSNRTIARQGVEYFAVTQKRGGLVPGIWLRKRFGHGSAVKPVFIYVKSTNYKARFMFHKVAQAIAVRSFPGRLQRELANAKATAR